MVLAMWPIKTLIFYVCDCFSPCDSHCLSILLFSLCVFLSFLYKTYFRPSYGCTDKEEGDLCKEIRKTSCRDYHFYLYSNEKKRPLRQSTEFLTFEISVCTICKFLQPLFLYAQSASLQHTYTLFFTQMHCKHIASKPNGTASLLFNSVEFNLILVSFLLHRSEYVC